MGTKIEWAEESWNPVTGCTPVSKGCENCYARRFAERMKSNPKTSKYRNGFKVTCHMDEIRKPWKWIKPRKVFVCSMGDLFHPDVPDEMITEIFCTMAHLRHKYILLTKRPERMLEVSKSFPFDVWKNIWVGISAENQKRLHERLDSFQHIEAAVKFISFEPLLGPINLSPYDKFYPDIDDIGWVIVGGETGPGARKMKTEWASSLLKQCKNRKKPIPFFFKQIGPVGGKWAVRTLDGEEWEEWPDGK